MKTWEYKVVSWSPEDKTTLDDLMNHWGIGGWEIITLISIPGGVVFYCKRPLANEFGVYFNK